MTYITHDGNKAVGLLLPRMVGLNFPHLAINRARKKKYIRNPSINICWEVVVQIWCTRLLAMMSKPHKACTTTPITDSLAIEHATDLPIYQCASGLFENPFYMRNKKIQASVIYDLKRSFWSFVNAEKCSCFKACGNLWLIEVRRNASSLVDCPLVVGLPVASQGMCA